MNRTMRGNKLFRFLDYFVGIPLVGILSLFHRRYRGAPLNDYAPRRILIIKFVALGDAVLLVPSLRAIKKKFPRSEIVFFGTHLTEAFLSQFPEYVTLFRVIDIEKLLRKPKYALHTLRSIRAQRCDVAIDFEQWSRISALFSALSGASIRLGFRTKAQYRHAAFTHAVNRDPAKHEVDNFLSLSRLLTGADDPRELEIKVDDASLVRAQGFLIRNGWRRNTPVVIVHPGCGTHGFPREWAPQHYVTVLNKLAAAQSIFIVVTGTKSESAVTESVHQAISGKRALYTISDQEKFVALLSLSALLISSNNGAMHLAAALQMPQIALHGPTNAAQWGPLNSKAIVIKSRCPQCPCLDLGFEYHRSDGYCMEQVDAEGVYEEALMILKRT